MNSHDVLDMIGDARGEHVWDAQQVRSGAIDPRRRKLPLRRLLLVAAILALSLLLVGCTVAYVQGWFAEFFTMEGEQPLSDSQIAFLEDNEQKIGAPQTINGWTLELGSVISDGTRGYILIGVTAPEGVSLERIYKGDVCMSHLDVGNEMQLHKPFDLLMLPEGVDSPYSYLFQEDGDGLPNTADLVIRINPNLTQCSVYPFGEDAVYRIRIQNIFRSTVNEEIWDGVSDIISFDPIRIEEMLVEGTWEFSFNFGMKEGTDIQQELVKQPFSTAAMHWRQYGEDEYEDAAWFLQEHTITSFVLKPLSATIFYQLRDKQEARFAWHQNSIRVVLRDGREIELQNDYGGEENQFLMAVSAPIMLDEVDHIRMVDGTRINMDGTVEAPEWQSEPPAAPPEDLVPGVTKVEEAAAYYAAMPAETGIYAYYTDFDGDEVKDIAVWQDGRYTALCYLTQDGVLQKTLNFETALTTEELCTQYGGEKAEDLERFELLKPIGVCWRY